MRIRCVTWNVARDSPSSNLSLDALFIGSKDEAVDRPDYDIIAIGLQEVSWNPFRLLVDSIKQVDPWSSLLLTTLRKWNYVQLSCSWESHPKMFGTVLQVFVKRELVEDIDCVETKTVQLGWSGYMRNKSGIALRLRIWGNHVTFINCHCDPHVEGNTQRLQQYQSVLDEINFNPTTVISDGCVFWMGDMNFRVEDMNSAMALSHLHTGAIHELRIKDQLSAAQKSGDAFHHFEEGKIRFEPTYKFAVGTSDYDLRRTPSWCDRILWKNGDDNDPTRTKSTFPDMTQEIYQSLPAYTCSDHKPVFAVFSVQFKSTSCLTESQKPVRFLFPCGDPDIWLHGQSNLCQFTVAPSYTMAHMDWIGIFKTSFSSLYDVVTWSYSFTAWETSRPNSPSESSDEGQESNSPVVHNLLFKATHIPDPGNYQLGYYSRARNCLLALTKPFRVAASSIDQGSEADDHS